MRFAQVIDATGWADKALYTVAVVVGAVVIWFLIDWLVGRWIRSKTSRVEVGDLSGQARVQRLETLSARME